MTLLAALLLGLGLGLIALLVVGGRPSIGAWGSQYPCINDVPQTGLTIFGFTTLTALCHALACQPGDLLSYADAPPSTAS